MGRCDHCGAELEGVVSFTCNFCDSPHCAEHRLPEAHQCVAVRATRAATPHGEANEIGDVPKGDPGVGSGSGSAQRSSPDKNPCQECSRPCPAEQTYCPPCQKDIRDRKRQPASTEEIREHWQQNKPDRERPRLSTGQRLRTSLYQAWNVFKYVVIGAILAGAYLEHEVLLQILF